MRRSEFLAHLSRDHHQALVAAQRALRLQPNSSLEDIKTAWQGLQTSLQQQIRLIQEKTH